MNGVRMVGVILLLAAVLAACGGPPAAQQATTAPAPDAATAAAPTGVAAAATVESVESAPDQGEITLTIWDFGGQEFEWIESIAIPAWQKEHPNIKIKHLGIPESDYSTKVETAVAAKDVPDIALQSYQYKLWKAGHLLPLDEFMAADGIKTDDFFPIFKSWNQLDGKTYTLPVSAYIWAMIYNKDLFKSADLPEPDDKTVMSFDQWLEAARKINKASDKLEDRVWGSALFVPNWNAMNNYMSKPYVLGDDARSCETAATTPDWMHTWDVLLTAYKEELLPEASQSLLGDQELDLFAQQKLGMRPGNYGDALQAQKAGINVGLSGQPVVSKGWQGNVGAWTDAYGIMSQSKHPKEAWEFLKFLSLEVSKMRAEGDCPTCGNTPAYRPAAEGWGKGDPLRDATLKLLDRVVPPPTSPDIWAAVDPFYEAWRRMTEENTSVEQAINDAAAECQEILDKQWEQWETLGE